MRLCWCRPAIASSTHTTPIDVRCYYCRRTFRYDAAMPTPAGDIVTACRHCGRWNAFTLKKDGA